MLQFLKKTVQQQKNSPPTSPTNSSFNSKFNGVHSTHSSESCRSIPLASFDDGRLLDNCESELIKQYSRLSKTLDEVLDDKSALRYLEQFLELRGGLSYVHCWIDVEQFKLEIRKFSESTKEDMQNTKTDHDSLSVSTDCDSYTADLSSLCDYSSSTTNVDVKCDKKLDFSNCDKNCNDTSRAISAASCKSDKNSSLSLESNEKYDKSYVRSKDQQEIVDDALRIFKTYVSLEAPQNIKCSDEIRNVIIESICDTSKILSKDCFDSLEKHLHEVLEKDYFQAFLGSDCFCKYQIDILTSGDVILDDILYNETALFYFMEFLEQENDRSLLEFWIAASNFQLQLNEQKEFFDPIEAQNDAVVLYDKYFSLQAHCPLGFSDKIRFAVEQNICGENGVTLDCFYLPLKIVEEVLRENYFKTFLSSQLFYKYLSELINSVNNVGSFNNSLEGNRCVPSDCSSEKSFSTYSTFLAMQVPHEKKKDRKGDMNIDTRQLYDPDSLWKRNNNNNHRLAFGRITSLGRYERHFEPEPDKSAASRIKTAVKKLVNIEEDKTKEEMAWKVAEMIVKDITDITLPDKKIFKS